jgi:hypothetical protein
MEPRPPRHRPHAGTGLGPGTTDGVLPTRPGMSGPIRVDHRMAASASASASASNDIVFINNDSGAGASASASAGGDNVYMEMLKSDIFQVQMRLEKLNGTTAAGNDKLARPSTPLRGVGQGRRRSEFNAIKRGVGAVDSIVAASGNDTTLLKFRLLDFLFGKVKELEQKTLLYLSSHTFEHDTRNHEEHKSLVSALFPILDMITNNLFSDRASSASSSKQNDHSTSAKRLIRPQTASSLRRDELVKRSQQPFFQALQSTPEDLKLVVVELEEHLHMLEDEISVHPPFVKSKQETEALPLATRINTCIERINFLRERGVRFLQKELEELEFTNRSLADKLEEAHNEIASQHSSQNKDSEATATQNEQLMNRVRQAEEAAKKVKSSSDYKIHALSDELNHVKKALKAAAVAKTQISATLESRLANVEEQLQSESSARESQAVEHDAELQALQDEQSERETELQQRIAQQESELAEFKIRTAELEKTKADLITELDGQHAAAVISAEQSELSKQSLNTKIAVLEKTALARQQDSDSKDIVEAIEAAERACKVTQSLEVYHDDLSQKREIEMSLLRADLRKVRQELEHGQEHWKEQEAHYVSEIDSLREQFSQSSNSTVDDFMRQEMSSMKTAFQLKIAHLQAQLAQQSTAHSAQLKQLRESIATLERSQKA